MRTNKIVMTGGHAATPGIAVYEELISRVKNIEVYWIGSKISKEGSNEFTLEYKIFPKLGIKFISIPAGKLQTKFTRYTISSIVKIPLGFLFALTSLVKIHPDVVLSFGGYASLPVVFWGYILGIPVILHEQTAVYGRASKLSSLFAKLICVSYSQSLRYFPKQKTILTGNPILKEILELSPSSKLHETPTILFMGGSRGSQFINEKVLEIKDSLIKKYKVIQITGDGNYVKSKSQENERYKLIASVEPHKMAELYKMSDLIVSRSGANTVAEVLQVKKPAIFIPLPRTFMDEQFENAKIVQNMGGALILSEKEATSDNLLKEIEKAFRNWNSMKFKSIKTSKKGKTAAGKVVDVVLQNLK